MDYPLHPMLLPFPIALLVTSVLFDAIGRCFAKECLQEGAIWLLAFGLLGGIAAAFAGNMAEEAAEKAGFAEAVIETHETLAIVTLGILGALFIWRLFVRQRLTARTMTAYFLLTAIGLGMLSATGHFGGESVTLTGAASKAFRLFQPPSGTSQDGRRPMSIDRHISERLAGAQRCQDRGLPNQENRLNPCAIGRR